MAVYNFREIIKKIMFQTTIIAKLGPSLQPHKYVKTIEGAALTLQGRGHHPMLSGLFLAIEFSEYTHT